MMPENQLIVRIHGLFNQQPHTRTSHQSIPGEERNALFESDMRAADTLRCALATAKITENQDSPDP